MILFPGSPCASSAPHLVHTTPHLYNEPDLATMRSHRYRPRRAGRRRGPLDPVQLFMQLVGAIVNAFSLDGDAVGGVENPLMPSCQQAQRLPAECRQMDIESWYSMIRYQPDVSNQLFRHGHNESLRHRARGLAQMMTQGERLRSVVIMDGHGRFLYDLIRALRKQGVTFAQMDGLITVVDNAEGPHMWHEAFFPKGVNSVYEDIVDYVRVHPDHIAYLNFCGIGSMDTSVRVQALLATRVRETTLLSFETQNRMAGVAGGPAQSLVEWLQANGWVDSEDPRPDGFRTYVALAA
jgi:hypothetical protein